MQEFWLKIWMHFIYEMYKKPKIFLQMFSQLFSNKYFAQKSRYQYKYDMLFI